MINGRGELRTDHFAVLVITHYSDGADLSTFGESKGGVVRGGARSRPAAIQGVINSGAWGAGCDADVDASLKTAAIRIDCRGSYNIGGGIRPAVPTGFGGTVSGWRQCGIFTEYNAVNDGAGLAHP